ncbi:hypothetical protein FV222_11350 [Methylobacterium sp. WL103]|nr:hypothetical protein FV226_11750 [Methylobacterium sp. WL12]TXN00864.1 hypothetical protein FV222_11350 [Methylobacterium sp. WL103]
MRLARVSTRLLAVLALAAGVAQAQGAVADGEAPDLETSRAATAAIGRRLGSADARVSSLRTGRGGIMCGSVDVRNRMGTFTGPRPFVFEPGTGVVGRLPEGPELRNPASIAEYRSMERTRALFAAHCID